MMISYNMGVGTTNALDVFIADRTPWIPDYNINSAVESFRERIGLHERVEAGPNGFSGNVANLVNGPFRCDRDGAIGDIAYIGDELDAISDIKAIPIMACHLWRSVRS